MIDFVAIVFVDFAFTVFYSVMIAFLALYFAFAAFWPAFFGIFALVSAFKHDKPPGGIYILAVVNDCGSCNLLATT